MTWNGQKEIMHHTIALGDEYIISSWDTLLINVVNQSYITCDFKEMLMLFKIY